ncbi:16S rRNA (guanine(527)-N(7))-methyltransferase RsmG [Cellulomonas citrea]|uniref:16S rRNA (guanine(527)-N(7))-methyltransferase RsmG n=1 Tax=Cellulomonas citrea TaxID=1909423 RepID=UPI001358F121|nr:16S rRNA (guanine(527)-N(7))-methyltransferase RsmG [Cellulomonas citrea]
MDEIDVAVAATDPLAGSQAVRAYFGDAWPVVSQFDVLLREHGVVRGLIGPREPGRLWERHLLNSAAAAPLVAGRPTVLDLGSGAGLPGVVLAAMLPQSRWVLLEPMERRVTWLTWVVGELGLSNVEVVRGRAEDVVGRFSMHAVTTRAVGSLDKLYRWSGPLLRHGGVLVALKGERAAEEVAAAQDLGERLGFRRARVDEVRTVDGVEPTSVVVVEKSGGRRGSR